ncbi:uncharacterized protein LOC108883017 isoform X2 [Lates calcarifer]|uniref:Uncharacterized protein LOC108883017 isoform X2 n=1 Tax=Lates calcarifer TaxID=8187 RepID=A0AAJ8AXI2_LATCA|nr:uncharacterized protein LOC108883017 isoform X2 [Lates calcarifer]XP_050922148.1 uncharacterized protein LOC108883017 isoform X2 [Lates calcarifer]XP_050922149.1 uncharacterized protein LOC108883017 isoform X2 [Lates calcarifer]
MYASNYLPLTHPPPQLQAASLHQHPNYITPPAKHHCSTAWGSGRLLCVVKSSWFIGDRGYAAQERSYSERRTLIRAVVERTVRLPKARWMCCDTAGSKLLYTPEKVLLLYWPGYSCSTSLTSTNQHLRPCVSSGGRSRNRHAVKCGQEHTKPTGLLVQLLQPGQKHQRAPYKPNRCHHFVHNRRDVVHDQRCLRTMKFFETRTEASRIQTLTIISQR